MGVLDFTHRNPRRQLSKNRLFKVTKHSSPGRSNQELVSSSRNPKREENESCSRRIHHEFLGWAERKTTAFKTFVSSLVTSTAGSGSLWKAENIYYFFRSEIHIFPHRFPTIQPSQCTDWVFQSQLAGNKRQAEFIPHSERNWRKGTGKEKRCQLKQGVGSAKKKKNTAILWLWKYKHFTEKGEECYIL